MKILTSVVNRWYNKLSKEDVNDIIDKCDLHYNDTSLPLTCTMSDTPTCSDEKELAVCLVYVRNAGNKYTLCNLTDEKKIPLYEKFGFTKVASYMGGHKKMVHSMQADISKLRSRRMPQRTWY